MTSETYGVRARVAWYWRRLKGQPSVIRHATETAFLVAPVDPRPPWRRPSPQDWSGWQQLGATEDEGDP
jgi:hypothetical protein